MTRFALLCVAVSGCFYAEPINQRPSLDIRQRSVNTVYRGDSVTLDALASDPEGHYVTFKWRAYRCTDELDCDQAPFFEGSDPTFTFVVPNKRGDDVKAVEAVHVWLEGIDDFGATARPAQQLWIPISDRAPTLELAKDSKYGFIVTKPIGLYAKVGDLDDGPEDPQLSWQVFTPTNQPAYDFVDLQVPADPNDTAHVQYGKLFTPKGIGDWTIEVTATDTIGEHTTQTIMVSVNADGAPCLRTLSPVVAVSPAALPMSEPTLFQVHVVADDLDPFPTINDPELGTTRFTWSVLAPGGSRQVLDGITGNQLALDPASYQPGDLVEVRVEIADRNATAITCADASATCSVISDNNCIQRQTWRVEVR